MQQNFHFATTANTHTIPPVGLAPSPPDTAHSNHAQRYCKKHYQRLTEQHELSILWIKSEPWKLTCAWRRSWILFMHTRTHREAIQLLIVEITLIPRRQCHCTLRDRKAALIHPPNSTRLTKRNNSTNRSLRLNTRKADSL